MRKRVPDLTGKEFGKLKVLHRDYEYVRKTRGKITPRSGKLNGVYYKCQCSCGNSTTVYSGHLITGKTLSCGCHNRESASKRKGSDLIGKTFGKLTVIAFVGRNKRGNYLWKCACTCGKETVTSSSFLINKLTKSCGCLQKEWFDGNPRHGVTATQWQIYLAYRKAAKDHKRTFELTVEDFLDLTNKNCFYCDTPPSNKRKTTAPGKPDFIYSGIDRLDNKHGYVRDNCVPCCRACNQAKHTMPLDVFKSWISKLVKHFDTWKSKGI